MLKWIRRASHFPHVSPSPKLPQLTARQEHLSLWLFLPDAGREGQHASSILALWRVAWMLLKPKKSEEWHPAASTTWWDGKPAHNLGLLSLRMEEKSRRCSGVLPLHRVFEGTVSVPPNVGCRWRAGVLWMPGGHRVQERAEQLADVIPENLQCHKQAPEEARDYEPLKNQQGSPIEKLHTQASESHPNTQEKFQRPPEPLTGFICEGLLLLWSQFINVGRGGCFFPCVDPNIK